MSEASEIQSKQAAPATPKLPAPESKEQSGRADVLMIFGQGPVVDSATRDKAENAGAKPGEEDVNLWSKNLAQAGAEIVRRGDAKRIVVMGGRTGGRDYASEAELIAKGLAENGVSAEKINLEAVSTNTLENIVNFINEYMDGEGNIKSVDIMGTAYHLPRIKLLMEMLHIPYRNVFASEEVIRFVARAGKEAEEWDASSLQRIEDLLDVNSSARFPWSEKDKLASRDIYSQQEGTEKKNILRRLQEEDHWSRALLEEPAYWLLYVGRIKNAQRMRAILADQDPVMLRGRFGIDLSATDEELRTKLTSIKREMPDIDQGIGKPWGKETADRLQSRVDQRRPN